MRIIPKASVTLSCVLAQACADAPVPVASATSDANGSGMGTAHGGSTGLVTDDSDSGIPPVPPTKFDALVDHDLPPPANPCVVGETGHGVQPCPDMAPPNAFNPVLKWSWSGAGFYQQSAVTPLVANLTDDNSDGNIDLCDTPDLVLTIYQPSSGSQNFNRYGRIAVLDGATGNVHWLSPESHNIAATVTPALGDIDGDGLLEIVAAQTDGGYEGRLIAYRHDGTLAWVGDTTIEIEGNSILLADLDADGDVEIVIGSNVSDHEGHLLWNGPAPGFVSCLLSTAVDLDGDGKLEVIAGARAYRHDGALYYDLVPHHFSAPPRYAFAQVADMMGDGKPEVVMTWWDLLLPIEEQRGVMIIGHDGTVIANQPLLTDATGALKPTPVAIHDIDGDTKPEILLGEGIRYSAFSANLDLVWSADVLDFSGIASGTAFDFLGDGTAEGLYADETTLFAFDELGGVLLDLPRSSWTSFEYPVVADVDNDGSADIVVVSNQGYTDRPQSPLVQVFGEARGRWVPARRIWNQHAYHVTNIREDGTIPQVQPPHWLELNTFRTQAQIAPGGGVCQPMPPG